MVSIGQGIAPTRVSLSSVRAEKGMILEEAEARRLRSFITIFVEGEDASSLQAQTVKITVRFWRNSTRDVMSAWRMLFAWY
jgi:hypothetical protein